MRTAVALALAALLLALAGPAPAGEKWESVTSKEGQFTVDLPARPTVNQARVRKGPGGDVKTVLVGTETDRGTYLAMKVVLPATIVKGTEDAELDAERDAMAREWDGTVVAEKRIRAGTRVGRDFTVRGHPYKGKPGVVTVRVREYLAGNAIYLVAVISPPDDDLPADAGRFLGSLALGDARARVQGTPEPDPAGTPLPGWGVVIDPDRDCKVTPVGRGLRFEVPAARHDLYARTGLLNAPRAMRAVEGDFVLTVKVAGEFRPGGKSTNPEGVPYTGAGILVWSDSDNFIRLERAAVARGGRVGTYVAFAEREGGADGAQHNEPMRGGDCWLRVQRTGSRIRGAVSFDGKAFKQLKPIDTVWPARLKVGVAAVSSSGLPFAATIEEFDLKTRID